MSAAEHELAERGEGEQGHEPAPADESTTPPADEPPAGGADSADASEPPADEPPAEPPAEGEPAAGDEDQPAAEPPPDEPALAPGELPAGMTERELEKAARAFDRAATRYLEAVEVFTQTTGQSLVRNRTDLEYAPGFIFHPDVMPLDEEQQAFCRMLLGEPLEPPFVQDPASHECETCEGWGRVKTGSKVAGQNVANCSECGGRGYKTSRDLSAAPPPPSVPAPGDTGPVLSEQEQAAEDAWGTPRSHPDWGKSPQYRGPNWQAELEAYKGGAPAPVV